jgi:DNA-binding CsgD family transcriptional regulator
MHIKHIYGKLGVRNRVQALAQARSRGILTTAMHY